jgi:hypothetical protein
MNHSQFVSLIEGFCKECGLDQPERILHGGPIAVGDVVFSLIYSEQVNPELIFVYCDFGSVPPGQEMEAYRALLEANMFLYTGSGPAFTLSSETGRVVLAEHYKMSAITPKELREKLVKLAEQAKAWRVDHFLDRSPRAAAADGRPAPAQQRPAAKPADNRAAPRTSSAAQLGLRRG